MIASRLPKAISAGDLVTVSSDEAEPLSIDEFDSDLNGVANDEGKLDDSPA